jgi:flagellar hook protein FlgE
MSLLGSMLASASGLDANSEAIQIVSNNIANVNTVGYKALRGHFENLLGGGGGTAGGKLGGIGARLARIEQMFSQGALLGTGVTTDLAIDGAGFFIVRGNYSRGAGTYYSRAGQFQLDADGRLVNNQSMALQGYSVDSDGTLSRSLGDLVVPVDVAAPPKATSKISIVANLDASSTAPSAPFDPQNPSETSNFSTAIQAYDSRGRLHVLNIFFRANGNGGWEWHVLSKGDEVTGGTPGQWIEAASGTLNFTSQGTLDVETAGVQNFNFKDAQQNQQIEFEFGDAITTDDGVGRAGVTSYAAPSALVSFTQDGMQSGLLTSIAISSDGRLTGSFTNGEQRLLGQVALAKFANPAGLSNVGGALYQLTEVSGQAVIGAAGEASRGQVLSGTLEQSNVNLGDEFINLIAYQRGFQAGTRTVKIADEMLSELVNLIR